jgi:hypothetical protein
MTYENDSSAGRPDAPGDPTTPIIGDPLMTPPDFQPTDETPVAIVEEPVAVVEEPVVVHTEPARIETNAPDDEGGSKAKAAALLAGAAALANKMRKEAPKAVHQLRERRIAGRCVIVTEVDGRFLAIGPYKDEESARQDSFKVGGTPHVAELMSESTFFAPAEQP